MNLDHKQRPDCPDWSRLVAQRDELSGWRESLSWSDALRHFDSCPDCRPRALAADSTLLFRRLPGAAQPGVAPRGGQIAIDIEAMKSAVATLRRTVPLQNATVVESSRGLRRRLSAVAAGLLFAALLGLTPGGGGREADVRGLREVPQVVAPSEETTGAGSLFQAAGFVDETQSWSPSESSIEDVELPNTRVYQFSGEEMTIVTVVNGAFDV